MIVCEPR